jgi:hypothetical protein
LTKEALKLALDYIVATNKSSEFWLVPASNLNNVVTAIKEALAQPEQRISDDPIYIASDGGFYPMPRQRKPLEKAVPVAQEPHNFCPRCGKRTPDLTTIHTCTPPRGLEMT